MAFHTSPALRAHRLRRGWTQASIGELAGLTRQAYASVESGRSVPSTEVALRLARALGVPVEALFELRDAPPPPVEVVEGPGGPLPGRRVRRARIGGREIAYGLEAGGIHAQVPADGIGQAPACDSPRVQPFAEPPPRPDLVVAGCDPAFGLVAEFLRRERGIEVLWLPAGSRTALDHLAQGNVHMAGIHLRDAATGTYNEPWIRRLLPFAATRVTFATWEQVLVLGAGNPLGIGGVADLTRPGLRFVNREPGSGSRATLELLLSEEGIPEQAIPGFDATSADGHDSVAAAIAAGTADAGVAIRAVALARNLEAVPLASEPYEFVIPDHFLELPAVAALLEALRRPSLQRQIEALGGYDTASMGAIA